ncbi:lantibiotic immunity ABC transporter MutG family permease subunit [Sporosarcina cascadiensis]|uniref:lantibiotic immunity ABC transporter MutG family permease subunit n=1 Tax=Sporosarcina cascadiensis TaxID=2660747 RepID=UPI00129B6EEC|nr:lantibiotic immunity ABC transporter MutG family permease subunit [Sporosarcina cascadiensis]
MKRALQLWKAERVKCRRTAATWVHILVPITISFLFLWYYHSSPTGLETKWETFIQVLAIGFPFMISIVVSIAAAQEHQSRFAVLIAGTATKSAVLVVKMARLTCWGIFSLALAISIFGIGMYLQNPSATVGMYVYFSTVIIFISGLLLYVVHWLVELRLSRNYSIALGLVKSLLAAVFMTGLGDGIWMFVPSSWAVRYTSYYLAYNESTDPGLLEQIKQVVMNAAVIDIAITLLLLIGFFLWFTNWEGEHLDD